MSDGIAVLGMSARLPGADDIATYWSNLLGGRDCLTRRTVQELRGAVPDELLDDARWVGASGRIAGAFDFDPARFGMPPRTATLTDPQHRLLLTLVAEALEDAALVLTPGSRVGVYAGVGGNRHQDLVRAVMAGTGEIPDELALEIGNEKDHASTKLAFRFDLTGPAVTVQSACSTGLVAVHQACQALAAYECDLAVVAAAAVRVPDVHGYLHYAGSIGSADGVCRPFSARATGAVAGDGAVALVLKRGIDAVTDDDPIHAIIRGSAVNNDGAKSGYGSVSADAQRQVIRDALLFAEVEADSIGSIEAHGSGTALGDATEWAALASIYGHAATALVGSVKSNLGHLREASGLAGLVRAIMSVREGRIPPVINVGVAADFTRTNTHLKLARVAQDWPRTGTRRASVSALGLGGTNAHVLVDQPPERAIAESEGGTALVLVSGGSDQAAIHTARRWAEALRAGATPQDAATVSQQGRRHRSHRRFAVGSDPDTLARGLLEEVSAPDGNPEGRGLSLVFPGVGDHYPGMTAGLQSWLPEYDREVTRLLALCSDRARRELTIPPPQLPARGEARVSGLRRLVANQDANSLSSIDTVRVHATLFCIEVALARQLEALGLSINSLVGHSLGELAAATFSGVFAEDEAIDLVISRAELLSEQTDGAMLAVGVSEDAARDLLGEGVWLSAVNSPRNCVLGGERAAVVALAERLAERGAPARLLSSGQALHTPLMRPVADSLRPLLVRMTRSQPRLPMATNVTGNWEDQEYTDPDYWHRHLTSTVHFGAALRTVAGTSTALVEVGPGQLRTLAAQSQGDLSGAVVVGTVRREYQDESDRDVLLRALGTLWRHGEEPRWSALPAPGGRRVAMPATAPDERLLRIDAERPIVLDGVPVADSGRSIQPVAQDSCPPTATTTASRGKDADDRTDSASSSLNLSWQEVLGTSPTPMDDFFDLGGDSLMSVQLIRAVERHTGVHVPAVVMFEESRFDRMATRITQWMEHEGKDCRQDG